MEFQCLALHVQLYNVKALHVQLYNCVSQHPMSLENGVQQSHARRQTFRGKTQIRAYYSDLAAVPWFEQGSGSGPTLFCILFPHHSSARFEERKESWLVFSICRDGSEVMCEPMIQRMFARSSGPNFRYGEAWSQTVVTFGRKDWPTLAVSLSEMNRVEIENAELCCAHDEVRIE